MDDRAPSSSGQTKSSRTTSLGSGIDSGLTVPYALLTLSMLFWAGNWILGRALHETMAPSALAFWRWSGAVLILLPIVGRTVLRDWPEIRRNWLVFLGLSVTGAALSHWMIYSGLRHTTAINALLIYSTQPAWIVAATWLTGLERVTPRQLAGLALSFLGTLVIVFRGDPAVLLGLEFNIGDVIVLAAMPAMAFYPILLRRYPMKLGSVSLLFGMAVMSTLVMTPFFVFDMFFGIPTSYTLGTAGSIVYLALVASVLAYYCFNRGVEAVGANRAGFFAHLLPAFGTVMAVLFLGESVQAFHFIGIALIFAGVTLSTSARVRSG